MKLLLLALKQFGKDKIIWVLVLCQLTAAIIIYSIFYNKFSFYVESAELYKDLELKNVVSLYVTAVVEREQIKEEAIEMIPELRFLSTTMTSDILEEGDLSVYSVPQSFIDNIDYKNIKGEWFDSGKDYGDAIPAVIPKRLESRYTLGKTYTVNQNNRSVNITVIGVLNGNAMFYPVTGDTHINDDPNTIMVYESGENRVFEREENTMMTYICFIMPENADVKNIESRLENIPGVRDVTTGAESYDKLQMLNREEMGLPLVLAVLLLLLSFIGFSSYNIITLRRKEKLFAIGYLSGANTFKCILLQLINGLITISIPIISASLIIKYIIDIGGSLDNAIYSGEVITGAIALSVFVFMITSIYGIVKISREKPIDIIRRWL